MSKTTNIKQGQEVNPVEVWEGIDTREENGRNSLTKLAIHVLSVVANSAGCERAFSHMGLVHTGIRSKLKVEKVRKTTMVGMDLKRMHLGAGLLHNRDKRNFTGFTQQDNQEPDAPDGPDHPDISNGDDSDHDLLDFNQLSQQLIMGAASANVDKDIGDDNDDGDNDEPPPPIRITIPPLNSATHDEHRATPVKKTSIPLKILFNYPAAAIDPLDESGMNSFWKGGIQNLEKEMEACELLMSGSGELEENVVNPGPEIPT